MRIPAVAVAASSPATFAPAPLKVSGALRAPRLLRFRILRRNGIEQRGGGGAADEHATAAVAAHVEKQRSSVLNSKGLPEWLRENAIDTLTLVGYMTNNCVLASAAAAEPEA